MSLKSNQILVSYSHKLFATITLALGPRISCIEDTIVDHGFGWVGVYVPHLVDAVLEMLECRDEGSV